jgi:hypothetical protein
MILGDGDSLFISALGQSILLSHSVLDFQIREEETELRSETDGTRYYVGAKNGSEFNVLVHLFKYEDAESKYREIYQFKGQNVRFYPHANGISAGTLYLQNVQLLNINSLNKYDYAKLNFLTKTRLNLFPVAALGYGKGYGKNYGKQL